MSKRVCLFWLDETKAALTLASDDENWTYQTTLLIAGFDSPVLKETVMEHKAKGGWFGVENRSLGILQDGIGWLGTMIVSDQENWTFLDYKTSLRHLHRVYGEYARSRYKPTQTIFPQFLERAYPDLYVCEANHASEIRWDLLNRISTLYIERKDNGNVWIFSTIGNAAICWKIPKDAKKRHRSAIERRNLQDLYGCRLSYSCDNSLVSAWEKGLAHYDFLVRVNGRDVFEQLHYTAKQWGFEEPGRIQWALTIIAFMCAKIRQNGKLLRDALWYYIYLLSETDSIADVIGSYNNRADHDRFVGIILPLLFETYHKEVVKEKWTNFVGHKYSKRPAPFPAEGIFCDSEYIPIAFMQLFNWKFDWTDSLSVEPTSAVGEILTQMDGPHKGSEEENAEKMQQIEQAIGMNYEPGHTREFMQKLGEYLANEEAHLPEMMVIEKVQRICAQCGDVHETIRHNPTLFWDATNLPTVNEHKIEGYVLFSPETMETIQQYCMANLKSIQQERIYTKVDFSDFSLTLTFSSSEQCTKCTKTGCCYYFGTIERVDGRPSPIMVYQNVKNFRAQNQTLMGITYRTLAYEFVHKTEKNNGLLIKEPGGHVKYLIRMDSSPTVVNRMPESLQKEMELDDYNTLGFCMIDVGPMPIFKPEDRFLNFAIRLKSPEIIMNISSFSQPTTAAIIHDFRELMQIYISL